MSAARCNADRAGAYVCTGCGVSMGALHAGVALSSESRPAVVMGNEVDWVSTVASMSWEASAGVGACWVGADVSVTWDTGGVAAAARKASSCVPGQQHGRADLQDLASPVACATLAPEQHVCLALPCPRVNVTLRAHAGRQQHARVALWPEFPIAPAAVYPNLAAGVPTPQLAPRTVCPKLFADVLLRPPAPRPTFAVCHMPA